MDPHTSDSEDEDDEDFVLSGAGEEDEDISDEGEGKRRLDDDEVEDKPKKKQKKYAEKSTKPGQQTSQELAPVETEKKVADIWEEMKKNTEPAKKPSDTTDSTNNNSNTTTESPSTSTPTATTSPAITTKPTTPVINSVQSRNGKPTPKTAPTKPQTFTFAGEKIVVPKPAKGGSALDNLVSVMGKKNNKLSVLDKSKLDWDKYKTATGSSEELAHQKKNGYLEKVAFLQRTDQLQFELEKKQRQSVRESSYKQGLK